MDFLQANGLWLVLGFVLVWLVLTRAGRGCGVGRHDTDRPGDRIPRDQAPPDQEPMTSGADSERVRRRRGTGEAVHSRHRGC